MSVFGQVWFWSLLAFLIGALLTWVLLFRPERQRNKELERRAKSGPTRQQAAPRDDRGTGYPPPPPPPSAWPGEPEQVAPEVPEPPRERTRWMESDSFAGLSTQTSGSVEQRPSTEDYSSEQDYRSEQDYGTEQGYAGEQGYATEQQYPAEQGYATEQELPAQREYTEEYRREEYPSGGGYTDAPARTEEQYPAEEQFPAEEPATGRSLFEPDAEAAAEEQRDERGPLEVALDPSDSASLADRFAGGHTGELEAFREFEPESTDYEPDTQTAEAGMAQEAEQAAGGLFESAAPVQHTDSLFTEQPTEAEPEHRFAEQEFAEERPTRSTEYTEDLSEPRTEAADAPDAAETTSLLPKRQRGASNRIRGGFEPPRPIQPSVRPVARRTPQDSSVSSGSLFEPSTGDAGAQPPPARTTDAGASVPSGPFGPGSAMPLPGGGRPSNEFAVKASVTALRYCTEDSPQFPRMVAEVWFASVADAERVGFRPLT